MTPATPHNDPNRLAAPAQNQVLETDPVAEVPLEPYPEADDDVECLTEAAVTAWQQADLDEPDAPLLEAVLETAPLGPSSTEETDGQQQASAVVPRAKDEANSNSAEDKETDAAPNNDNTEDNTAFAPSGSSPGYLSAPQSPAAHLHHLTQSLYQAFGCEKAAFAGSKDTESPGNNYILAQAADHLLAFPLTGVLEVARPGTITPVPFVPPWILGICQRRGEVVTVIDLQRFWNLPLSRGPGRLLFCHCQTQGGLYAFYVQAIKGQKQLQAPPQNPGSGSMRSSLAPYITTIAYDEKEPIGLVDLDKLLQSPFMQLP